MESPISSLRIKDPFIICTLILVGTAIVPTSIHLMDNLKFIFLNLWCLFFLVRWRKSQKKLRVGLEYILLMAYLLIGGISAFTCTNKSLAVHQLFGYSTLIIFSLLHSELSQKYNLLKKYAAIFYLMFILMSMLVLFHWIAQELHYTIEVIEKKLGKPLLMRLLLPA